MVTRKEIDEIKGTLDDLFWEGEFEKVDDILKNLEISTEDDDTLITYLTATLYSEVELYSRNRLYEELIKRGYSNMDLGGLKG